MKCLMLLCSYLAKLYSIKEGLERDEVAEIGHEWMTCIVLRNLGLKTKLGSNSILNKNIKLLDLLILNSASTWNTFRD